MGMSASQARLLSITARLNDVEFKSQEIANIKVRLADESQQLASDYTKALSKQKLTYVTYSDPNNQGLPYKVDLTISNLNTYDFQLVDASGNVVDAKDYKGLTSAQMYAMIESGEFRLQQNKKVDGKDNWVNITATENYNMNVETDSTEFAKAEAEYNAANMKINNKEKLLDNELKKLDTEHNALQTESDSIKDLISKNIEKSFNLFA